jgi:uncharacterized caspase-like protein
MAKRNIDLDFVEEKRPNITRGKNYLFVIAIDEYQPPVPRLHNCVSDAKAFVEVLLRRYDYFHTNTTKALYNSEATRSAIRKQLDAYCRTLSSEDSLVIYFAGHGEVDDSITKEGYWIPADSKGEYQDDGFANRDVTARLREDTLKARHVLLFSDSCFSGSRGTPFLALGRHLRRPRACVGRRATQPLCEATLGLFGKLRRRGLQGHHLGR